MNRLDPTPDTWRAWRGHLRGQATTVALATGRTPLPPVADRAASWSGPAFVPAALVSGGFADAVRGAGPLPGGWLTLDDQGLVRAPADGSAEVAVPWGDVASTEVAGAWWRSRAGVRLHCGERGELWFDAPRAEGLDKALEGAASR